MNKAKISKLLRQARFRVSLPFFSYEVTLDDVLDSKNVDERIKRLSTIRTDLEETVHAVTQLQAEALQNKKEAEDLRATVEQLKQDKSTTEAMLKLPEDSIARVLARASSRGRIRGIIEGIIIGLITGGLSSYFIWYVTK